MTWFDYGVLVVLLLSVVLSLLRGLVREVVSLLGWIAAFVVASMFGDQATLLLPESLGPLLSGPLGFLLVFIGVLMLAGFVGLLLSLAVRAAGFGLADRALGSVFGLARGLLIVLTIVLLAGLTPLPREQFWRDAVLSRPVETAVLALKPWLPRALAQRVKYR